MQDLAGALKREPFYREIFNQMEWLCMLGLLSQAITIHLTGTQGKWPFCIMYIHYQSKFELPRKARIIQRW